MIYMIYQDAILRAINDFLGERLYRVTLETKLDDIPEFDSLEEVELVMSLETDFDIEISDPEAEALPQPRHIKDYVKLVNDKLLAKYERARQALPHRTGPSLLELAEKFKDFDGPEVSGKIVVAKKPPIRVSATLTEEQQQMWLKLGGANWLRRFLAATAKGRSQ